MHSCHEEACQKLQGPVCEQIVFTEINLYIYSMHIISYLYIAEIDFAFCLCF